MSDQVQVCIREIVEQAWITFDDLTVSAVSLITRQPHIFGELTEDQKDYLASKTITNVLEMIKFEGDLIDLESAFAVLDILLGV